MKKLLLTNILMLMAVCAFAQEDVTSYITNPSFEDGLTGWTNENMKTQTNSAFSLKVGTTYAEKWVSSGSVGSASLKQTLKGLPNGEYKLTAAAQNYTESTPATENTGATLFAGTKEVTVKTPKDYTVSFTCITGDVEIGFVATDATGNWLCVDNFRLSLVQTLDAEAALAELQKNITSAEKKQSRKMSGEAASALSTAIEAAKLITAESSNEALQTAALNLQAAVVQADASYQDFNNLRKLNSSAKIKIRKEMSIDATNELNTAYEAGTNLYDNPEGSTDAEVKAAIANLEAAIAHADTAAEEYKQVAPLMTTALSQQGNMMSNSAAVALTQAILLGEAITTASTDAEVKAALAALTTATADAKTSIALYKNLQTQLTLAQESYDASKTDADKLKAEIDKAQALVENGDSDPEALEAEVDILKNAVFAFNLANATPGTGTAPEVTETNHYVATGATQALMRATIVGDDIMEQGVCWSTEHEPTVLDNRSTKSFSLRGTIFHVKGMQPATVYYLRPYVINKTYTVAYGDEVKIVTHPMGNSTWSWDEAGPDEATNTRCRNAIKETIDYFNEWTGIMGFHLSGHYMPGAGAGSGTADCSYGGYMRISQNQGNQAIGTVLHEAGHGVGVGTGERWSNTNVHSWTWFGRETNDVYHFLENIYDNADYVFVGDGTHGWGQNASYDWLVNGSSKDTHQEIQYIGGMCILHGLFVDGLDPTSDGWWYTTHNGIPSYTYNFDDNKKYYLMCKDSERGLGAGLLYQRANTAVAWKPMFTGDYVTDEAAWYMEFDPKTSYYYFKNAESGRYLTHANSSIGLTSKSTPTTTERFQLMPDRTDVTFDLDETKMTTHGYWFTWTDSDFKSMAANALSSSNGYGSIAQATFDYSSNATKQMWLILSEDELASYQEKFAPADGIGSIQVDNQATGNRRVTGIYSANGIQLQKTQQGFNIIKYSDGSIKKIYVK